MREFARGFYTSKAWKQVRASYIAKVHGLCERCSGGGKIVHHKIYLNETNIHDPMIALSHDNLEYLCQDCHNDEHMGRKALAKGLRFDENGDVSSAR
jgi:5-methylcytosine-specific restriction endonuclease McrA